MKIITDFKDYYDHGMAFGIDEGIVYERFKRTIHPPEHIVTKHGGILGFCNQFWEVMEEPLEESPSYSYRYQYKARLKTYEERSEERLEAGWIEGSPVFEKYDKHKIKAYYWLRPVENINTMEWLKGGWRQLNYTHYNNWLSSIFMEHSVPSFYVDKTDSFETTLNPTLLDYGVQKILDPVQAFQELSTFIPSLRVVDTFDMTNEQKGRSKGFDEYSFRNKNTKNKPKKF